MLRFSLLPALFVLSLAGCAQEDTAEVNSLDGRIITVVVDGSPTEVDLGGIELVETGEVTAARLGDILRAAGIEPADGGYVADIVSVDGFHPGAKTPCKGLIPLDLDLFDKGFIAEFTGETLWDEALDFPGCMHVNGLSRIVLFSIDSPANEILVGKGDTAAVVDLRFMPVADDVGATVSLKDVVGSILSSPETFRYDLEGADGQRPGRDLGNQLLTWDQLKSGLVSVDGHNVTFQDDAIAAVWEVGGLVRIVPEPETTSGKTVKVTVNANTETVDLGTLPTSEVGGLTLVTLSDVVLAAGLESGEGKTFKLIASDGFDPIEVKGAAPLTWEQMQKGYLDPTTRDASFDPSLALPGFWAVKDVSDIQML